MVYSTWSCVAFCSLVPKSPELERSLYLSYFASHMTFLFLLFLRVRARWPNVAPTTLCSRSLAVSIRKCGTRRAATCRALVTPSGRQRKRACPRRRRGRNCRKKSSTVWKAVETVPAKSHETFSFLFFDYMFALKQNCFIKKIIHSHYLYSFYKIYLKRGFELYIFHNLFNVSIFFPKWFSWYCLGSAQIIIFVTIWLYPFPVFEGW